MKTESSPKVMKILNEYAGGHRHLITLGRILAAVSAFMGLVPFYDLYQRCVCFSCSGSIYPFKGQRGLGYDT